MAMVLVAGGSGFIGSHIVRRLAEKGHQVVVMSRHPERAKGRVPAGVTFRTGDVSDPASLRSAMAGIDVVVAAVQFPNHPVEKPTKGYTYVKVDGEGTTSLVAAASAAGVKRFIYIGGAGTRPGQTAPWFQGKLMAEQAVRESGIPYTIFRPSWVYGPDDRTLNKFAAFARLLPFIPVIGNGRTRVQPVFVDDVAEAVAASIAMEKAAGQVYEIGGPQELTMDEIIRTMLKAMGRQRPLVHHPAWFMKLVTAPMTLLPTPPLSPAGVDFVLMEEPVDNSALLRDLNIRLTPLSEGLAYLR
ncbi:MAG: putative NADH-ubiquinone oxidoreductase [Firmicutes bacterium]|nr:putative NADH-ubiquinone oxidoreductase [Bacillota bacterium]